MLTLFRRIIFNALRVSLAITAVMIWACSILLWLLSYHYYYAIEIPAPAADNLSSNYRALTLKRTDISLYLLQVRVPRPDALRQVSLKQVSSMKLTILSIDNAAIDFDDPRSGVVATFNSKWLGFGSFKAELGRSIDAQTASALEIRKLTIPIWAFVVFSSIPLCCLLVRFVRSHRKRATNSCIHCGYNLTGLESARCPECGNPINSLAKCRSTIRGSKGDGSH